MVNNITKTHSQPRYHINWQELRKAYQVFMTNPAQGILHILAAGRYSRWNAWMMARLRRQAKSIVDQEVHIDLATLSQLSPDTLGGAYALQILISSGNSCCRLDGRIKPNNPSV